MTGNPKEQLEAAEKSIRDYLQKLKMEEIASSDEVCKYLTTSQERLQKLSASECNEAAFLLNREALFVQKERNILTGKISWANMTIDWVIGKRIDQYNQYLPYEKKRMLAVQDNDYCKILYGLVIQAQRYLDATSHLPNQLKNIADTLIELARSKRSEK